MTQPDVNAISCDLGFADPLQPVLAACLDAIAAATTIVVTSHAKPDGDAMGSCLGLARVLRAAGKEVCVAGLAPIPRCFAGLPQAGELEDAAVVTGRDIDLLIALDAASRERLPEGLQSLVPRGPVINIDHHGDNTGFGDINLVDAGASSTGEMLFCLTRAGGYPLSRESAMPLWIAIVTDTGRFSHANTTPRAMHAAAELLAYDVPTAELNRLVYGSLSHGEVELQRRLLGSLTFHEEGRVVFCTVEPGDFEAAGCGPEALGDLIEIPRAIEGVEVAALFHVHASRPGVHVSTRSNGACDVGALCRSLGGGGHARAAGCTLPGEVPAVHRQVLQALRPTLSPAVATAGSVA